MQVLLAEKDAMESWMTRTPPEWHATCRWYSIPLHGQIVEVRYIKEAVEEAHRVAVKFK